MIYVQSKICNKIMNITTIINSITVFVVTNCNYHYYHLSFYYYSVSLFPLLLM